MSLHESDEQTPELLALLAPLRLAEAEAAADRQSEAQRGQRGVRLGLALVHVRDHQTFAKVGFATFEDWAHQRLRYGPVHRARLLKIAVVPLALAEGRSIQQMEAAATYPPWLRDALLLGCRDQEVAVETKALTRAGRSGLVHYAEHDDVDAAAAHAVAVLHGEEQALRARRPRRTIGAAGLELQALLRRADVLVLEIARFRAQEGSPSRGKWREESFGLLCDVTEGLGRALGKDVGQGVELLRAAAIPERRAAARGPREGAASPRGAAEKKHKDPDGMGRAGADPVPGAEGAAVQGEEGERGPAVGAASPRREAQEKHRDFKDMNEATADPVSAAGDAAAEPEQATAEPEQAAADAAPDPEQAEDAAADPAPAPSALALYRGAAPLHFTLPEWRLLTAGLAALLGEDDAKALNESLFYLATRCALSQQHGELSALLVPALRAAPDEVAALARRWLDLLDESDVRLRHPLALGMLVTLRRSTWRDCLHASSYRPLPSELKAELVLLLDEVPRYPQRSDDELDRKSVV